jgi:hypothetical protein
MAELAEPAEPAELVMLSFLSQVFPCVAIQPVRVGVVAENTQTQSCKVSLCCTTKGVA